MVYGNNSPTYLSASTLVFIQSVLSTVVRNILSNINQMSPLGPKSFSEFFLNGEGRCWRKRESEYNRPSKFLTPRPHFLPLLSFPLPQLYWLPFQVTSIPQPFHCFFIFLESRILYSKTSIALSLFFLSPLSEIII